MYNVNAVPLRRSSFFKLRAIIDNLNMPVLHALNLRCVDSGRVCVVCELRA